MITVGDLVPILFAVAWLTVATIDRVSTWRSERKMTPEARYWSRKFRKEWTHPPVLYPSRRLDK